MADVRRQTGVRCQKGCQRGAPDTVGLTDVEASTSSESLRGRADRALEIRRVGLAPNFARRAHRVECARHQLCGASPARGVGRLRFEQLRIRQDDTELIIQPVEQCTQV